MGLALAPADIVMAPLVLMPFFLYFAALATRLVCVGPDTMLRSPIVPACARERWRWR